MNALQWMMSGGVAVGSLVVGFFFLRFWRQTRDRFFLFFMAGFWLEAASRVMAGALLNTSEDEPIVYLVRLVSYGLIIVAIWQKNRPGAKDPDGR